MLLRLWNLNDISIPVIEKAIRSLPQYSNQELGILTANDEFRFVINNTDKHEAECKLYRELAFHYANTDKTEIANNCRHMALRAIEKSKISGTEKLKYKGLIWGDYAKRSEERRVGKECRL